MTTKKLVYRIISSLLISTALASCGGNSTNSNPEERTMTYIVNHPDDVGKYGEGTYINMNTERTCPHCGLRVSVDNIFHDCQGTKFSSRGNSNKYSDGYEQGQEDARQGLESNPDIHSSNGQFKKGYEDGYEDW